MEKIWFVHDNCSRCYVLVPRINLGLNPFIGAYTYIYIYVYIYIYTYIHIYIYINIGWLCLLNWTTVQSNEYEKGTWQHLFCSTHVLFRMVSRGFTVRPTVCNLFGPRPDDLWFGGILCPGLRLPMKVVRFAIPNMIKLLVFRVYQFREWVCYIDMNFLC